MEKNQEYMVLAMAAKTVALSLLWVAPEPGSERGLRWLLWNISEGMLK